MSIYGDILKHMQSHSKAIEESKFSMSDASEPDWMVARSAKKQQKDIDAVTDLTAQYETEFDQSSLQ